MTLQEQLEIIQAAIAEKEIQYYCKWDNTWRPTAVTENSIFNFDNIKYRIKPEPKKEIKLHQYLIKNIKSNIYFSSQEFYPSLNNCILNYQNLRTFEVIKVLPHTEITVTED